MRSRACGVRYSALLLTPPSVTITSLPSAWRQRQKVGSINGNPANDRHCGGSTHTSPGISVCGPLLCCCAVVQDGDVESGECNGRCYLLIHSLHPRDVAQFTPLVCDIDGTGVLVDRFPSRIADAVVALIAIETRYFVASSASWRSLPSLDPFDTLSSSVSAKANVLDTEAMELLMSASRRHQLRQTLESNPLHSCPQLEQHVALLTRQSLLAERVDVLRACLDEGNLSQMAEYGSRLELLQRLHYIDADRGVLIKGRVACELNTCDSLLGTELIFDNALGELTEIELLATLSCLVFKERGAHQPQLDARLQLCRDTLLAVCSRVARASDECGLDVDVASYASEQVNCGLMEVVQAWAEQQPFVDICQLTNVLEGSIVRAVQVRSHTISHAGAHDRQA